MNGQPLYPEESGWIMAVVGILLTSSIIPAAFVPYTFINNPASGISGLLTSTATYAFAQASVLVTLLMSLGKKIIGYFYVILILAIIFQGISFWNDVDHKIAGALDKGTTKYTLPASRNIVLPTTRFVQLTYDMGICWWDLYAMYRNILIRDAADVLVNCEAQNWQTFVNLTITFVSKLTSIPLEFVQGDGLEPFDFESSLTAFANMLLSLEPALQCACLELQFIYDILFGMIGDVNLAQGLDRLANVIIYYPFNITIGLLAPAFDSRGPIAFECTQSNFSIKLQCDINRPPKFDAWRDEMCDGMNHTAIFLEHTVNLLVNAFISEFYQGNLFTFHKIIYGTGCTAAHLLFDLLDLLTHIDLVFTGDIQYLKYMSFNQMINVAEVFCDGIRDFWDTFNDFYTTQLGIIFGEDLRIFFRLVNEIKNFAIALFDLAFDHDSLNNYFVQFSGAKFSGPFSEIKNATFAILNQINTRLSDVAAQGFDWVESVGNIIYSSIRNLTSHFKKRQSLSVNDFVLITLPPLTNATALHFHSMMVAAANFLRQFDESNACNYGSVTPPMIIKLTNPAGHVLCDLANLFEVAGQYGASLITQILSIFYEIYSDIVNNAPVSNISPFIGQLRTWVDGDLGVIFNNTIFSVAGMLSSEFGDIDCPCVVNGCSTGTIGLQEPNVRTNFHNIIMGILDVLLGISYHGLHFFFDILYTVVSAPSFDQTTLESLLCTFWTFVMDFFGRVVYVFKAIGDFLDCLIGAVIGSDHINFFSGTIYNIFFDATNTNSVRNMLCSWIHTAIDLLTFIHDFFQKGFQELGDLITQGGTFIANKIIDLVNDAINTLNGSVGDIQNFINNILSGVRTIICFINQIKSTFGCLNGINVGFISTPESFVIPGTDDIPINLPPFGSFDIPGIPATTISFHIPLPDFGSINSAISCLSTNLGMLGSGCGSGCGSGSIQPGICSGTFIIPDIPDIQHLSKRQIIFDNTTYSFPENDTLYETVLANYSSVACQGYKNLAQNTSLALDMNKFFTQKYIACMFSSQLTFSINWMLFKQDGIEYLDPQSLTSIERALMSLVNFGAKIYYPIANEIPCVGTYLEQNLAYNQSLAMTNSCIPWDEYYVEKNLTSKWVYAVGKRLETVRLDYENTTAAQNRTFGWTQFFATVWNVVSGTGDLLFNPQPGLNMSLYDSFFSTYNAYSNSALSNSTVKRFYAERIAPLMTNSDGLVKRLEDKDYMGLNVTSLWNNVTSKIGRFYQNRKQKVTAFLEPKTPRAHRNRYIIFYMMHVTRSFYKEYSLHFDIFVNDEDKMRYVNEDRNLPMIYSSIPLDPSKLNGDIYAMYTAWTTTTPLGRAKILDYLKNDLNVVRGKRQTFIPNPFDNLTEICNVPTVTGGTTCINCTLLFKTLDDIVSRTLECIAMTELNWDLFNTEFFEPFVQLIPNPFTQINSQTAGVLSDWMNEVAGLNFTDAERLFEENRYKVDKEYISPDTASDSSSFNFFISPTRVVADFIDDTILHPIAVKLFGFRLSAKSFVNYVRFSFTDATVSAANTAYFWLNGFLNAAPTMNCKTLAERGIGIGNLPLTYLIIWFTLAVLAALLSRINAVLVLLIVVPILTSPYLGIAINYGVSPFSAPALPFCLMDNFYSSMLILNTSCVNYEGWMGGLTQTTCPDSSTDFARTFQDCSAAPFYFNNPWRVLYFGLQLWAPSALDILRTNQYWLLSLFRSIPDMEMLMHFDYEPGEATTAYMSCAKLRAVNIVVLFYYFAVFSAIASAIGITVVLTLTLLGSSVYYLGLVGIALSGTLADTNGLFNNQFYKTPQDFIDLNLAKSPLNIKDPRIVDLDTSTAQQKKGGLISSDSEEDQAKKKKNMIYIERVMRGITLSAKKKKKKN
jgi:hypothetical protein